MKYRFDKENHIHLLDERPLIGTSTATKIIAKPLTWWASGMAVGKLGWTNSKIRENGKYKNIPMAERLKVVTPVFEAIGKMSAKAFLELLDKAYRAHDDHKKERAEAGTDRHALLEEYVKGCLLKGGAPLPYEGDAKVKTFTGWAQKNVKKFLWSELHCYSEVLWTGGICDVGWESNQGETVVGDFKSSKEAYFDQFVQVAGYDIALSENGGFTCDGEPLFEPGLQADKYCIVPFGSEILEPEFRNDINDFRNAFSSAVFLHKLNTKFGGN